MWCGCSQMVVLASLELPCWRALGQRSLLQQHSVGYVMVFVVQVGFITSSTCIVGGQGVIMMLGYKPLQERHRTNYIVPFVCARMYVLS
jgi:hypothetical protein